MAKKITKKELNRINKKLGLPQIPRQKSFKTICKEAADKLDWIDKQGFMNLMKEGKTLGEASEICGITQNAALGVLMQQERTHVYYDFEVKK